MKRFVLGKLFIISAALIVLSFISCNQNLKEENGMGKVVISLGNTARNVNTEGLPILDEHNTTITINVAGESEQHHHDHHPRTYHGSKISVEFPIGTQIKVAVYVETDTGNWYGSQRLTVKRGINNVNLQLSERPSEFKSISFSVKNQKLSVKIGNKFLIENASPDFKPQIKRDGIGRVYILYKDNIETHLTRYTVEGDDDTAFNRAISTLSEQKQNFINNVENIAVDTETGNIFLIKQNSGGKMVYCIDENMEYYSITIVTAQLPSYCLEGEINSAAAYNGTLFLEASTETGATHTEKLLAYKTELKTENNMLELTPAGETVIENISPEGQSGKTDCNDIHADGTGVYVLLSSTSLKGNIYSVGQINRYKYDGGNFEGKAEVGCVDKGELQNGGIAYDNNYNFLSKPIAFIGWDNDNLYIADDGINIEYKNENFRVNGNKNKGAEFDKTTNELAIYDLPNSDITWYEEYPKYEQPNTPVLSWEKDFNTPPTFYGMRYWTSAEGKEAFSSENELWKESTASLKPTDIFCYDQDGNLYIVYIKDNDKMVRRFELKYDGEKFFYAKDSVQYAELNIPNEPTAIAVDISNGKNCLYYAYEEDSHNKSTIKKYNWSNDFTIGEILNVITETTTGYWIDITALAANQYGLFAAIKNVDITNKYTLSVKKYKKDGSEIDNISEVFKHETADSHGTTSPYNSYTGAINALQIRNNILYGIMSEVTQHNTYGGTQYSVDGFKNGSRLYGFGKTDESLFKSELINKTNNDDTVGYGFYRFIAVQENNLVIASDGAWEGKVNGTMKAFNNNKVFTCNFNSEGSISSISQTDDLTTVKYTIQK